VKSNGNGRGKPRPIPDVLTPDEQARLLAQIDLEAPSGNRNLAILRLMINTGLRAAEVRELRHRNIDWERGRMKVRGKGGRDRVLWVNADDLALLKSLPSGNPSGTLFTSLDGQKPICGRWLREMVPRLAKQAGIDKRIHPHTLRHTFATNLLSYTKNLFLVSKALGHANLSTTQIYLHLVDGELEAAMKGMDHGNP
jgi:site-specific recombinase XerD